MADFLIVARANINLVHGSTAPEHIRVEQYDGDWYKQLELTLYSGSELYEIGSDVTSIVISGTKQDGTGFSYYCTWDGAVVYAPLMRQMTVFWGNMPVNLTLYDTDNNQLSSAVFILDIEQAALQSTTLESSNDFQTFVDYVDTAEYYKILAQSYAVGNTGIRTNENTDNAEYYWYQAKMFKGSPLVASTVAGMTDHDHVYVYTGSETGYTSGNWYYWNGTAWTSGGVYNSAAIQTDTTLAVAGAAADAKAVGDALDAVDADLADLQNAYLTDDPTEGSIDGYDYIPFYDTSAAARKKVQFSNINTGGSVITVRTSESDLYGKTVTVSDGGTTLTRTFNNAGVAVFSGVSMTGALTVSSTGTSRTATKSITIPYYSSYEVVLSFWTATVNIIGDENLYSATVTVYNSLSQTVGTVTLSATGEGTFTALEPDTYMFSATYNDDIYTNYCVVSEETTYTVELITFVVYGFHIDGDESDPASMVSYHVQYDGENVANYSYTPAYYDFAAEEMNPGSWNLVNDFFIPRSCMLKYDGTVDYYLDEENETLKADGTTVSDVANTVYPGNAMMEWGRNNKKIWMKIVPDTGVTKSATVYISDKQMDSDFTAYPFYDANGNVIDHFYTAKYNGSNVSSKLRSLSGLTPLGNQTVSTEVTYATANNINNAVEWYTGVLADRQLINMLLIMISKTTNSQAAFGNGYMAPSTSPSLNTGSMDGKGQWYGYNGTNKGVKVFGMENWWGNMWHRIAGWVNVSGTQKIKLTYSTADGSTSTGYDASGTGYTSVSSSTMTGTSGGYINLMIFTDKGMFPKTASGSATTYYCDMCQFTNNITAYAYVGGRATTSGTLGTVGAFGTAITVAGSYQTQVVGACLSCKPLGS